MTDRLHLNLRHRRMLEDILHAHVPEVEAWACGSRISGRSHDGSDLDLVLRSPELKEIPIGQLVDLEEALRESTIPFLIEARDWARLPDRLSSRNHSRLCCAGGPDLKAIPQRRLRINAPILHRVHNSLDRDCVGRRPQILTGLKSDRQNVVQVVQQLAVSSEAGFRSRPTKRPAGPAPTQSN